MSGAFLVEEWQNPFCLEPGKTRVEKGVGSGNMSGSSVLHTNTGSIKKHFWLLALILVAFFVRVFGIIHDLPFTYFGDEEHFINRSVAFGSGDFNPHWFHKPALYMYLLFFEYGMYFLIGNLLGWFSPVAEFASHYFSDMEPFLLIGRLTTTLFSLGIIYITFRIGEIHENRRVGLIAGLFLALCVGNFLSSIVVKADVPATFFAMLSLFFIFRIYEQGKRRDYLLAGLFAGLGMATKYYPIAMVFPMFVAHFLCNRRCGAPLKGVIMDFSSRGRDRGAARSIRTIASCSLKKSIARPSGR